MLCLFVYVSLMCIVSPRCGNPKAAIDCCVIQNRWDKALELAEEHDFPQVTHCPVLYSLTCGLMRLLWQVEGLLLRYAQNLLSRNKRLEAVELYRRANRPTDSAILIGDIAEQVCAATSHSFVSCH